MGPGEYESIRLKNLEDNKRVLAAFGLMNPVRMNCGKSFIKSNILYFFWALETV